MSIEIVVTDVDGTLLDRNHQLPDENLEAIRAIKAAGKHVVIASGRPPSEVDVILDLLDERVPVICANGAVIIDEEGNQVAKNVFDPRAAEEVVRLLEQRKYYQQVYTSKGNFLKDFNNPKYHDWIIGEYMKAHPGETEEMVMEFLTERKNRGSFLTINDYREVLDRKDLEYYKIFTLNGNPKALQEIWQICEQEMGLTVTSSWANNVEVNAPGCSKGNAILTYAQHFGYDVSQTMAIGDNLNDVSMFEKAGLSVAMGNASDEIKAECDAVTDNNDTGGWAKAIYRFVL